MSAFLAWFFLMFTMFLTWLLTWSCAYLTSSCVCPFRFKVHWTAPGVATLVLGGFFGGGVPFIFNNIRCNYIIMVPVVSSLRHLEPPSSLSSKILGQGVISIFSLNFKKSAFWKFRVHKNCTCLSFPGQLLQTFSQGSHKKHCVNPDSALFIKIYRRERFP